MKGFFKGFKNMFATKEHEMQIGLPTDVKHVSHIGWDSQSDHAPSWMKEFRTAAGYTSASISSMGTMESSWLNRGIINEPETTTRSRSAPFGNMRHNRTTSSREDAAKPSRIKPKKIKAKNVPGSPNSSTISSSSAACARPKTKIKNSNFRSCGAHIEDACMTANNPYQTNCTHEIA